MGADQFVPGVASATTRRIRTIEASLRQRTASVQAAFNRHYGLQCGFSPGQIMRAIGLIPGRASRDDLGLVREGMSGNLADAGLIRGITNAVL